MAAGMKSTADRLEELAAGIYIPEWHAVMMKAVEELRLLDDPQVERAAYKVRHYFEEAQKRKDIRSNIAWALYQAWREYDNGPYWDGVEDP